MPGAQGRLGTWAPGAPGPLEAPWDGRARFVWGAMGAGERLERQGRLGHQRPPGRQESLRTRDTWGAWSAMGAWDGCGGSGACEAWGGRGAWSARGAWDARNAWGACGKGGVNPPAPPYNTKKCGVGLRMEIPGPTPCLI